MPKFNGSLSTTKLIRAISSFIYKHEWQSGHDFVIGDTGKIIVSQEHDSLYRNKRSFGPGVARLRMTVYRDNGKA